MIVRWGDPKKGSSRLIFTNRNGAEWRANMKLIFRFRPLTRIEARS
jgi:hypothetical protein